MDLWALGCIIYHMISGEKPFDAKERPSIIRKILNRDIKWTVNVNGAEVECFSPEAKDLIDKLL